MINADSRDPDTRKVLEIMQGASRGQHDPDVELATIVSELIDVEDDAPYKTVLAKLIRNADSD